MLLTTQTQLFAFLAVTFGTEVILSNMIYYFNIPFISIEPVGKKVKCTDVPSFPSLEIKIGGKTLLLESTFYTRQYGDKCYNLLKGKGTMWTLGNPFLAKFYTSFDLKEETITFHVAV